MTATPTDELPYYVMAERGPHLVIPYTLVNNDTKWAVRKFATGEDFLRCCERLSTFYTRRTGTPKMMNVGMHMRLLGHPGRASGLARFLDYVKSKPDVWVCQRVDIAKHWLAEHPCEVGR